MVPCCVTQARRYSKPPVVPGRARCYPGYRARGRPPQARARPGLRSASQAMNNRVPGYPRRPLSAASGHKAPPVTPWLSPPARSAQADFGPFHTLGVWLAVLVVIFIYSRLSDRIAIALGFNPFLVLTLSAAAFVLMVFTGGLMRALLAKPGITLTLFTLWLLAITPFSVWKGGSFGLLRDYWSKSFVLYIILAGLLVSAGHCRKVLYAIGVAALIVVAMALAEEGSAQQRLDLGLGTFGNPNDLAFYLCFGLPGCVLFVLDSQPFRPRRLAALAGCGLLCVLVFQTGSRMGLLMLLAAAAFILLTASLAGKAKLLAGGLLLVAIAMATTGKEVQDRYRTMFGDPLPSDDPMGQVAMAQGSTSARTDLLKASLIITAENPLLGVGPGMFNVAAAEDEYTARTLFAAWRETHNTFTQVSSETGIPGFLIYMGIVASVFVAVLRVWRRSRDREHLQLHHRLAYCLMLMLVIFIVGAMFGSSAYSFFLPTLAGLAAALTRAYDTEAKARPSVPGAPPSGTRPPYGPGLYTSARGAGPFLRGVRRASPPAAR